MDEPFTIGSLFSGCGILELAVELVTGGEILWQAELSPFRREILAAYWPGARRFEDVHDVGASSTQKVDFICGGFPCVGISNAGHRRGLDDDRSGLWFEYERILDELRPSFAFIENPVALTARGLEEVLAGLDRLGYSTRRGRLAAGDPRGLGIPNVGASHERQRLWILAYSDTERLRELAERNKLVEAKRWNAFDLDAGEEGLVNPGGIGEPRSDGRGCYEEERATRGQRRQGLADAGEGGCEVLGEAHDDDGRDALRNDDARRRAHLRGNAFRYIVDPDYCPRPDFRDPAWGPWLDRNPGCEPGIPREAHGVAGRVDRHRRFARRATVGDSVSLQAAYWALRGLTERSGQLGLWG